MSMKAYQAPAIRYIGSQCRAKHEIDIADMLYLFSYGSKVKCELL